MPRSKPAPQVRAAIYCRISSDKETAEGLTALGVKRQEQDCRKLCADRGWTVIEPAYVDNNISAADPRKRRPAYQRLLNDIKGGLVDAVVVWAEDRLHRRPAELEQFVSACDTAGMSTLASVSGDINLNDPDALMLLRIKGAMAAREVAKTRQRIMRKQLELAEAGKPAGGGRRPFGYEKGGIVVRESEAALIREAAGVILAGGSLRSVWSDWAKRGVPSVSGKPWTVNSVKSVLRNPRTAGLRQYQGEVFGDAVWPAILDRETWDQLQVVFDNPARRSRVPHRNYPLRGVLLCGNCGHRMSAAVRKKPVPGKPGETRQVRYYSCRKDAGGCDRISVTAEHVERIIYDRVLGLVDNPGLRQRVRTEHKTQADEVRRLVLENAQDEKRVAELEDAFAAGDLSRAGLQRNKKRLTEQIEARNSRIATLQGASALDRFRGRISERWDEVTPEEQRTIILSLVSAVEVLPRERAGFNKFDPRRLRFRWRYGALAQLAEDWEQHAGPADRAEMHLLSVGHAYDEDGNEYETTIAPRRK